MGFFDIFKNSKSSKSSSRSPKKKRGSSSRKKTIEVKSTKQPAKTSADSSKTRTQRIKPTIGKEMTRAERSVINKERHRQQRELEAKAAATKQGSKRRRDVFRTRGEHKEYLGSEIWKTKRGEVTTRAKGKCEICGASGSTVHHLRYTKPGAENPSHLAFVCNSCHRRVHGTQ